MKEKNNQVRTADMMLTSPAGTPYPFTIIIRDALSLHLLADVQ
ncbi:MAG: hypothetical protein JWR72_40 [Flavisolibacter sp.]|nr:hypothetical protein [Flavisolibacter sp.]